MNLEDATLKDLEAERQLAASSHANRAAFFAGLAQLLRSSGKETLREAVSEERLGRIYRAFLAGDPT